MRIPIEPGTLCWIVNTSRHENNGKVAEVVARGAAAHDAIYGEATWWCVSKAGLIVYGANSCRWRSAPPGERFLAGVSHLVPIAGPGLKSEVESYDKRLANSTGRHPDIVVPNLSGLLNELFEEQVRRYGSGMPGAARSTPFARR